MAVFPQRNPDSDDESQETPKSRLLEFCKTSRTFREYEEFLSQILGISLDSDSWKQVSELAGGWDLTGVFSEGCDTSQFGIAWKWFLDSTRPTTLQDNCIRVAFLGCILYLLESRVELATQALDTVRLRYSGTRREVLLRLGTALFFVARAVMTYLEQTAHARVMLEEAVALWPNALVDSLPPVRRRICLGQRGAALVLLARKDIDPIARMRLKQSIEDLAVSRELGDESQEHYEYELETLNRLFQSCNEVEYLEKAISLRDALTQGATRSPALMLASGDTSVSEALFHEHQERFVTALTHVNDSNWLFNEALRLVPPGERTDHIHMRLARGLLKAYVLNDKLGRKYDESTELDDSIQHFRDAGELAQRPESPYPSALYEKARRLKEEGHMQEAMVLIDEAQSSPVTAESPPEALTTEHRLKILRCACLIWIGHNVAQMPTIRDALRQYLEVANAEETNVADLSRAVRDLLDEPRDNELEELLEKSVEAIEDSAYSGAHVGEALRFHASNAATLLLKLHGDEDIEVVNRAHHLLRVALEATQSPPAAELLGQLADTSLTLAEARFSDGDQAGGLHLLEDAVDFHLAGIEQAKEGSAGSAFDISVAHSKLSVLYLRRESVTGNLQDAESAITHMQRALESDDILPPRFGHLGDAYYRIGQGRGDIGALKQAVEYKRLAREGPGGDKSRENRSLTAKILLRLWHEEGILDHITQAIREMAMANQADPQWPWPFFQIGDAIEQIQGHGLSITQISDEARYLLDEVKWDAGEARLRACELAARTTEFQRRVLGGQERNVVHVLADPHHLLSETVVLKRVFSDRKTIEMEALSRLAYMLQARGAPSHWRYPEPIGIVSDDTGGWWYAARYVKGVDLGRVIYEALRRESREKTGIYQLLYDAARFLALFHVSAGIQHRGHADYKRNSHQFWANIVHSIVVPLDTEEVSISRELRKVVPVGIPLCQKKDPHTGNWLVTPAREIVMLDFESTRHLPILYELAELLEDYPAYPLTAEGKANRQELVEIYMEEIRSASVDGELLQLTQEELDQAYFTFTLIWAVAGLRRVLGQSIEVSSSEQRDRKYREEHYKALLRALAEGLGHKKLAPIAKLILAGVEKS